MRSRFLIQFQLTLAHPRYATSDYGRDYRLGYSLAAFDGEGMTFELGVDAQRRESPLMGGTGNGVLGRASVGW